MKISLSYTDVSGTWSSREFLMTNISKFRVSQFYCTICAVTCDFQQCGILTSVDSDEPVQHPVRHRNSKLCLVSS